MRHLIILSVLALAACGENTGWNPNYSAIDNGSDYAKYLNTREAALNGKGPAPQVIPVQLPVEAPTAADISGKVAAKPTAAMRTQTVTVPANAPVAATGPYVGSTPVLVRYAHQERQIPGTKIYRRTGGSVLNAASACASYGSAEIAQRRFIAAGGPVIDPAGLDPDGDGFVCGWDPRPYRQQSGL